MKERNMIKGRTNTGFKGVTSRTRRKKTNFQASVQIKGKPIAVGTYDTLEEAVEGRALFITDLL